MNEVEFNLMKNAIFSADEKINKLKEQILVGSPTKSSILRETSALLSDISSIMQVCQ